MADIHVDYQELQASAAKLDAGKAAIEQQLKQLMGMIDNLVHTSFKTQSASPKFRESYKDWNTGAAKAIEGLEGMSKFLRGAIQGHQQLDSGLSSGLGNQ